jgi:alpha-mannosidase
MKLMKNLLVVLAVLTIPVLSNGAEKKQVSPQKVELVKRKYNAQLSLNGFKPEDLQVYSIGKSHIDLAWKWRVKQTRDEKCPATFRNAIDHSQQFPGFAFTQSSVQYYEWAREVDPKLFAEMQKAEKDGRWHLAGGMWDEPDGNMPEGESFARQFLYGQRFFLENFGHTTDICWMEDSFGYNWNLPQFAAKGG